MEEKVRVLILGVRSGLRGVAILVAAVTCFAPAVSAQRVEHYNSPLYSPRVYDPAEYQSNGLPPVLKEVGIEQKLGGQLPLDAEVKDENGSVVKLGTYFNQGRPVILAFVYYECPMLCSQVLNGLTGSLKGISLEPGKDFDVIALSFDARENDNPTLAREKKASYMERYDHPGTEKGWHFLTGTDQSIKAITSAAGFNYRWDEQSKQFAHAAAVMVVTPDGRMSRYFYGIDYAPKDLKFGLMDSAERKVGSPAEQLLLYCYHYDPASGRYGFAILRVMRLAGVATLLGLGAMLFVFWRRNRRKAVDSANAAHDLPPLNADN